MIRKPAALPLFLLEFLLEHPVIHTWLGVGYLNLSVDEYLNLEVRILEW